MKHMAMTMTLILMSQTLALGVDEPLQIVKGHAVPDLQSKDILGRRISLADYRGRVVVLMFSANWCGPCKDMYPVMREIESRYSEDELAVLGVMGDQTEGTVHLAGARGEITWRTVHDGLDGPISNDWHIKKWPTVFVIGHDGLVLAIDPEGEKLSRVIDEALKRRIADPSSKILAQQHPLPEGPHFRLEEAAVPELRDMTIIFAEHLTFLNGQPTNWTEIREVI